MNTWNTNQSLDRLIGVAVLTVALMWAAMGGTPGWAQNRPAYDVLITGGQVIDGTGNPWFEADVGIREGHIVAVGDLAGARAERTIDATGKTVVPGFIDLHSHADDENYGDTGLRSEDPTRRAAPNLVSQGVTTVVVNQDGRSPRIGIARQRAVLDSLGIGPNTILLVGHNTVRRQAMGEDYKRPATRAEIQRMRALVREGMEAGAFGLSAGLEYVPGRWSTTDEVVALAEEIVPYDGVYISHQRSESFSPMWWRPSQHAPGPPTLLDAVQETIEVGERTGATVVATHLKSRGAPYRGVSHAAVSLIERARERGVEVFGDQYPYTSSGSDGHTVLIPRWVFEDAQPEDSDSIRYAEALRRALDDAAKAADVRRDIAHEIAYRGGAKSIVVFEYPDTSYVGKSLAELADRRNVGPVEMAIRVQLEGFADRPGGARMRAFSFAEEDVETFAAQPWVATASDGGIALPEDGPSTHARFYGTFPRKIRRYALERGVLSVEDAIRSATSLPAQILGLSNRGLIHEGYWADVAVLDLDKLRDTATFVKPHQHAEGVEQVLINGRFVVEDGARTGSLPGRIIPSTTREHAQPARPSGSR